MTAMTSATVPASRPAARQGRALAVTRLIFVNKWSVLYLPTIILLAILAMNIVIWLLILYYSGAANLSPDAFSYSGALFYVFVYMLVVAVMAVARTFPFALGYGVTRRAFSLGAGLAFVLLSLIFSVIMIVLAAIERETGGWGFGGSMFSPVYFENDSYVIQFLMYFFGLLFFMFLGSAAAAVFVRWKATGLVAFFIICALLLIGTGALIVLLDAGDAVGNWIVTTGIFGIEAWSLVLSAIFAVVGYAILQRATPKG
jgi:hypothetical protein